MDIESKLIEDAARLRRLVPPKALTAGLRQALVAPAPPRRFSRWLRPVLAVATAAVITGLLFFDNSLLFGGKSTPPIETAVSEANPAPSPPGWTTDCAVESNGVNSEDRVAQGMETAGPEEAVEEPARENPRLSSARGEQPWLRVGAFSSVVLLAGAYYFWGPRNRIRRGTILASLILLLTLGNLWLLRGWLF